MPSTIVLDSVLRSMIPFEYTPDELVARLTARGIEVDEVVDTRTTLAPFLVGKVETCEKHSNADRLSVCTVSLGSDRESATIVCGAPNVAAGQFVAVAPVGLEMPDGSFTIERRKIRGIESEGMICSEVELGVGDNSAGILVLDGEPQPGSSLADLLGEVSYDIDITPNRGDCLGHLGIAREIASMTGNRIELPETSRSEIVENPDWGAIRIEDPLGCRRYAARLVRGVAVGPSPPWLQRRMKQLGVRSINNVVDAATWVMFETGHPLHAFDYSELAEATIVVRESNRGEQIRTLDGEERELPAGTVMIADPDKGVAIAGIMGGENSEIVDETTDVLIESAWFEPSRIRRSAKHLDLSTDASYRFERGADIDIVPYAVDRAVSLIVAVAGGTPMDGRIDVVDRPVQTVVNLSHMYAPSLLGIDVDSVRQTTILAGLGFSVTESDDLFRVQVPPHRTDVSIPVDLVEEIGRVVGYDSIPEVYLPGREVAIDDVPLERLQRRLRSHLVETGFTEIVQPYQTSPEEAAEYVSTAPIELANGLGRETSFMRSSLAPGMAAVLGRNRNVGRTDLRLFEIGKAFRSGAVDRSEISGIVETIELAIALAGRSEPSGWDIPERDNDLADVRGIVDRLFERVVGCSARYQRSDTDAWGIGAPALRVFASETEVGLIGPVDRPLAERHNLDDGSLVGLFDLHRIAQVVATDPVFVSAPRYPAVYRDLSVVVPPTLDHETVREAIDSEAGTTLESVELFDLFVSDEMEPGARSMSFRLRFRSSEGTLRDDDVDPVVRTIIRRLDNLGASIRS